MQPVACLQCRRAWDSSQGVERLVLTEARLPHRAHAAPALQPVDAGYEIIANTIYAYLKAHGF